MAQVEHFGSPMQHDHTDDCHLCWVEAQLERVNELFNSWDYPENGDHWHFIAAKKLRKALDGDQ